MMTRRMAKATLRPKKITKISLRAVEIHSTPRPLATASQDAGGSIASPDQTERETWIQPSSANSPTSSRN